jgi:mannan polymerase II complex ANP1 subunit
MEMELDGVGGVSILAKAKVFRAGVHFPAFSFEKHAETEGFGKVRLYGNTAIVTTLIILQMAKRMKFSVVGLPHYTIWHLYEPSVDDIRHMEEMEKERKEKAAKEKEEKERMDKIKQQFDNPEDQWLRDKSIIKNEAKKEYAESELEKAMKDGLKSIPIDDAPEKKKETKKIKVVDPVDEIKVAGK